MKWDRTSRHINFIYTYRLLIGKNGDLPYPYLPVHASWTVNGFMFNKLMNYLIICFMQFSRRLFHMGSMGSREMRNGWAKKQENEKWNWWTRDTPDSYTDLLQSKSQLTVHSVIQYDLF